MKRDGPLKQPQINHFIIKNLKYKKTMTNNCAYSYFTFHLFFKKAGSFIKNKQLPTYYVRIKILTTNSTAFNRDAGKNDNGKTITDLTTIEHKTHLVFLLHAKSVLFKQKNISLQTSWFRFDNLRLVQVGLHGVVLFILVIVVFIIGEVVCGVIG